MKRLIAVAAVECLALAACERGSQAILNIAQSRGQTKQAQPAQFHQPRSLAARK